jgi:hypothetical protein
VSTRRAARRAAFAANAGHSVRFSPVRTGDPALRCGVAGALVAPQFPAPERVAACQPDPEIRLSRVSALLVFTAVAAAASPAARADPGYYVVTAYDNDGLRTVDARYWTVKPPHAGATVWPEIGLGYGISSRWYSELLASYIADPGGPTKLSSVNWQNEFLLTQGQHAFDLALHASLVRKYGDEQGAEFEYGPVFQTDVGRTQLNGNLFFERGYGPAGWAPTQMKYQWQVRHRWHRLLNPGLQGFGELGPWDRWLPHAEQSHRAGPAIFGTLALGGGQSLLYQAAYLVGKTYGQRTDMFSMRVQYAF